MVTKDVHNFRMTQVILRIKSGGLKEKKRKRRVKARKKMKNQKKTM